LATGETILEGWASRLGPIVLTGFVLYLTGWTVAVFGALASTTGVAADLLFPLASLHPVFEGKLSPGGPDRADVVWSLVSVVAFTTLVLIGRYRLFELVMSSLTICMVLVVAAAALALFPGDLLLAHWNSQGPWLPGGSTSLFFAILGGTGSTVGVMAYSYWMRERGRNGPSWLNVTRIDLACCYVISALFGCCIMLLAAGITEKDFARIAGLDGAEVRQRLTVPQVFDVVSHRLRHELGAGETVGRSAAFAFNVALFATVGSSLLGMLQCIPYLFVDVVGVIRKTKRDGDDLSHSPLYRVILIALSVMLVPLVVTKSATALVIVYAVWGAFFMPFLAATLLIMNNRSAWVGELRNRLLTNLILILCLVMFGWAASSSVWEWWSTGQVALPAG
jgi:Mn2+/Fe2+ NRAMP family transporter